MKGKHFGRVLKVKDGDTILVSKGKVTREIRLASIDAPEKGQQGYTFSTEILRTICHNKTIHYQILSKDHFDRYVCLCYKGSLDLSLIMLQLGAAFHYGKYCNNELYRLAEAKAATLKLGIHNIPGLTKPWLYRKYININ